MQIVRRVVAILSALVLLAAVAGAVYLDWLSPAAAPAAGEPASVEIPPGDSLVVCPGELKLPGADDPSDDVVYDPRFDPAPEAVESLLTALAKGGSGGQVTILDSGSSKDLAPPLAITSGTVGESASRVAAFSSQAAPADAAGGTFQHQIGGDLRGVAAAACQTPATEAWLVAGSTEVGSSARLLLTNPGFTNVTANIELWSGSGKVDAVGLDGLVVPPESQRAVLLEGFVGDSARLAIHVTASGGELAVFMQHSRLEGLVPGGVEIAVPGAAPAQTLVVPGINVVDSTFDSPRTSALRVLNPSSQRVTIQAQLWGPDGPVILPALEEAMVAPGLVTDLSLGGLPAGSYVAVISADQPIVAAGLSLRPATNPDGGPEEFAWSSSAPTPSHGFVALPGANLTAQLQIGAASQT
ncbi:MAG: DUF5719 family protein, partial [Bifidobacteriaceae bacterium]|nr:DUF5719 family protein [Bifidobacteriaceae bacterium]